MTLLGVSTLFLFSLLQPLIAIDAWEDEDIISGYCPNGKEDDILSGYCPNGKEDDIPSGYCPKGKEDDILSGCIVLMNLNLFVLRKTITFCVKGALKIV